MIMGFGAGCHGIYDRRHRRAFFLFSSLAFVPFVRFVPFVPFVAFPCFTYLSIYLI